MASYNAQVPRDLYMVLRIGVNTGDILAEGETIHGDGVNIAARLERLAKPGGIYIGGSDYDEVRRKLPYAYNFIGKKRVHNIPEPVRVYSVQFDGGSPRDSVDSRLTISTLDSFASRWLMPRLANFRRAHPDINERLWTSEILANFAADGVSIAIRYGKGNYAGLTSKLLMWEYLAPVCSPELTQGNHPLKELADLKYHTLIHDYFHLDWAAWLKRAGVEGLDVSRGPSFRSSDHAIQAAVQGEGVALGRSVLVNPEIAADRLIWPFPVRFRSDRSYYVVYPPGASVAVEAFRHWIRDERNKYLATYDPEQYAALVDQII